MNILGWTQLIVGTSYCQNLTLRLHLDLISVHFLRCEKTVYKHRSGMSRKQNFAMPPRLPSSSAATPPPSFLYLFSCPVCLFSLLVRISLHMGAKGLRNAVRWIVEQVFHWRSFWVNFTWLFAYMSYISGLFVSRLSRYGYFERSFPPVPVRSGSGRGFAWSLVNWSVNRAWIGKSDEKQSWIMNYIFTVKRDPLTLYFVNRDLFR